MQSVTLVNKKKFLVFFMAKMTPFCILIQVKSLFKTEIYLMRIDTDRISV